jgi:threonine/homoserine/homoserine lactone efflux protein
MSDVMTEEKELVKRVGDTNLSDLAVSIMKEDLEGSEKAARAALESHLPPKEARALLTMFTAPTAFHGGFLLFVFGIGHALPVIFLSALLATARRAASDKIAGAGKWVTRIFGIVFVAAGIAIIVYALGGW